MRSPRIQLPAAAERQEIEAQMATMTALMPSIDKWMVAEFGERLRPDVYAMVLLRHASFLAANLNTPRGSWETVCHQEFTKALEAVRLALANITTRCESVTEHAETNSVNGVPPGTCSCVQTCPSDGRNHKPPHRCMHNIEWTESVRLLEDPEGRP